LRDYWSRVTGAVMALKPVRADQVRRPEPMGGLWAEPPMGSRSTALGQPPEAESFLAVAQSKDRQICPFLLIFGKGHIDRLLEHVGPGYTGGG